MMTERMSIERTLLGGLAATIVLTAGMYLAPLLGLPSMDMASWIATWGQPGSVPLFSSAWWMGMAVHLLMGIVVFPLFYSQIFYSILPSGNATVRGVAYGGLLFLFSSLVALPIMGEGFFFSHHANPVVMSIASLVSHLIYGAILGAIAGVSTTPGIAYYIEEKDRQYLDRGR